MYAFHIVSTIFQFGTICSDLRRECEQDRVEVSVRCREVRRLAEHLAIEPELVTEVVDRTDPCPKQAVTVD
jgi:hypothetical protein